MKQLIHQIPNQKIPNSHLNDSGSTNLEQGEDGEYRASN